MQFLSDNIEVLITGSYAFTFICMYLVVSFIFYTVRMTQIKILSITLEQKKNQARGRKLVTEAVDVAKKEKRKALVWPVLIFSKVISYAKEKSPKKKK